MGLEFDFTADHKIDGTNVLRSCMLSAEITSANPSQELNYTRYFTELEEADLFSGMVLIAKGDSVIYEGAHGFFDKKEQVSLQLDHQLVITSTTKLFTAVAIAQLVEMGKIELDEPVSTYLTDFPKQVGGKVTAAHLLTHTSGLELDELDGFMEDIEQARLVDDFYQLNLRYLPQLETFDNFAPLDEHDYSNENFDIMGKLIEVLTGQDFYAYLDAQIFKPLDMTQTGPIDMEQDRPNIAHNYQLDRSLGGDTDSGYRNEVPNSNLNLSRPAGSFHSNPRDLYLFMKALFSGELIKDKTLQTFATKHVENLVIPIYQSWYGYGFYINERNGIVNIGHAEGAPGISSRCEYYSEQDV
ncbi:MAG: serine hydrolase domain-containing protein [Bacteroidota bacterium]